MNSQGEFLRKIAEALSIAGIPMMVTGSLTSTHYGEPRSTNDIDIVIEPTREQLDSFVSSLSSDFYVSSQAASDAFTRKSMFNVIELSSGWKVDLIIRKDREFSRTEFARRVDAEILGTDVKVATPEDVILSKLEWATKGESERQIRDAASVVSAMSDQLDFRYMHQWALELGILDQLNRVIPPTD